jgi:hypothetical protein
VPAPLDETGEGARRHEQLVLVTTSAMRARRHPWALVAFWGWQSGLALVASWPATSLVHASYGSGPGGDAPLWGPGGHALLDWLWHEAHGIAAFGLSAIFVLVIASLAGLVPLATLMFAMAYATRERRPAGLVRSLAAGMGAFRAFAVLLVVLSTVQAALLALGAGAANLAQSWAMPGMGEARAQQLQVLVLAAFVGGASVVGVVHDLARGAVVRFKVSGLRALVLGTRTFRRSPGRLWWAWAWRSAAAAAPIALAAQVAGRLGGRGGFALALLAVLHQAVILSRVALRASWLGHGLRAVDTALTRSD